MTWPRPWLLLRHDLGPRLNNAGGTGNSWLIGCLAVLTYILTTVIHIPLPDSCHPHHDLWRLMTKSSHLSSNTPSSIYSDVISAFCDELPTSKKLTMKVSSAAIGRRPIRSVPKWNLLDASMEACYSPNTLASQNKGVIGLGGPFWGCLICQWFKKVWKKAKIWPQKCQV